MTITPNEIVNKEFKKVLRGYDVDEVDEFLEQVVDDYEKIYKENINCKEKINALSEKIEHYSNLEATLQNTLLLAQTAADQAKEASKKESELLIRNAHDTANDIKRKAEQEMLEVSNKTELLRQEYNMFKSRFRALLESQIAAVENSDLGTKIAK